MGDRRESLGVKLEGTVRGLGVVGTDGAGSQAR